MSFTSYSFLSSIVRFITNFILNIADSWPPFLMTSYPFSATQLVLRAHKEAVNSLSGNRSSKLGTVATVVAATNSMSIALIAMKIHTPDNLMDDMSITTAQWEKT
ncbi:unnamed protein product [Cuscuta epithymum]|uniref:Uncharacterized protein n=1 Tax=Cuscuta epithymum TaxID=186058 RepID=A0AAV0GIP9_9ASTE|nr:unnamed protein product [Cuscuta epithymum]